MAETEPLQLANLIPHAVALPAEKFRAQFGDWFLVGSPPPDGTDWSFRTGSLKSIKTNPGEQPILVDVHDQVWALRKAKKGAFMDTVLIGRASSNDVQIRDPNVSKLHARVFIRPEGLFIADAGSRNGTKVNGTVVPSGEDAAVGDNDAVGFGDRIFNVFSGARLWEIARRLGDG